MTEEETKETEYQRPINDLGMRVKGKHIWMQKNIEPTVSWRDASRQGRVSTELEPTTTDNIEPTISFQNKKRRSWPTTAHKEKHQDLMINSPI